MLYDYVVELLQGLDLEKYDYLVPVIMGFLVILSLGVTFKALILIFNSFFSRR